MTRLFQRWRSLSLFLASFLLILALNAWPENPSVLKVAAQTPPAPSLVQQGIEQYQIGQYTAAIALWEQALAQSLAAEETAVVRTNLAQAYREIGQLDKAIAHWDSAIEIYKTSQESGGKIAKLLAEQAQAYNDLGQHRRSIQLSTEALEYVNKNQDMLTEAAVRGTLGNAYWGEGEYESAIADLTKSLEISRQLKNTSYIQTALTNLGNVYVSRSERYRYLANVADLEGDTSENQRLTKLAENDTSAAQQAFEQSVQESEEGMGTVASLLNLNRLLEKQQAISTDGNAYAGKIASNRDRALQLLSAEPDSRDKAYALIKIAASSSQSPLLEQAIAVARNIGDARAESFAVGTLAKEYESAGEYEKAMQLTRQAQFAAEQVQAADSLYRWQWQAGRLLKVTGKTSEAIESYKQAIATLQSIRSDIIAANKDIQFEFRDSVEPVYRELIALLLDSSVVSGNKQLPADNTQRTTKIGEAVGILELLKLAELRNFFGDDCVQVAKDTAQKEGDLGDPTAALVYSVILSDSSRAAIASRTEMLVRFPNGSFNSYPAAIDAQQMQEEIDRLRNLLEKRTTDEYLVSAQKIYDLLIRPLEKDLAAAQIETLVFINDGVLRKVPMAALHDGQKFLIQKYAIANAPARSVLTGSPTSRQLTALSLGLTVARPPFDALTNVKAEVAEVKNIMGGVELLDGEFTLNRLQQQLEKGNYPIVHMATHGKFGADAENTFLLAFDNRITIEQLDNLLRSNRRKQPVELLTLSACQTAAGDNRSALGIAGVAVRAGVKSALATLWFINDEATVPLIEEFYTQLSKPNVTKAEALQKAQVKLIDNLAYNHPAVWSPFILIGNWQ